MKKIKVSNFRKVLKTWGLDLAPITFLTGTNNSGKSTIFKALLLLEDYVKSNNHFVLDFNGYNSRKHKIDCFSNAINNQNQNGNKQSIEFKYLNGEYEINLKFDPIDFNDGFISQGKLSFLKILKKDDSFLSIENTGGRNYILKIDDFFIKRSQEKQSSLDKSNYKTHLELIDRINEFNKLKKKHEEEKVRLEVELNQLILTFKSKSLNFDKSNLTRLNKILRELNISMDRAIDFLESKGIYIEKSPNTKISPEVVNILRSNFSSNLEVKKKINNISEFDFNNRIKKLSDVIKIKENSIISLNQDITDSKKKLKTVTQMINSELPNKKNGIIFMPEFSLDEFYDENLRLDRIVRRVLPKYFRDNENALGQFDESKELSNLFFLGDRVANALEFNVDYLSPQRNNQTRLYMNSNTTSDINELINSHSINPIHKKSKAGIFIKKWMNEFDIGEDFRIKLIEGVASKIEILENGNYINIVDKGFGAGQIFCILLKIALLINVTRKSLRVDYKGLRNPNNLILIEEPEANLHPALQSKLADLFLDAFNEFDIRFIIETHSEYILRKSQIHVRKRTEEHLSNNIKSDNIFPFAVYYFDKENGPYKMNYRNDGIFEDDFGSGFFDVASKHSIELLKRKKENG